MVIYVKAAICFIHAVTAGIVLIVTAVFALAKQSLGSGQTASDGDAVRTSINVIIGIKQ